MFSSSFGSTLLKRQGFSLSLSLSLSLLSWATCLVSHRLSVFPSPLPLGSQSKLTTGSSLSLSLSCHWLKPVADRKLSHLRIPEEESKRMIESLFYNSCHIRSHCCIFVTISEFSPRTRFFLRSPRRRLWRPSPPSKTPGSATPWPTALSESMRRRPGI